MIIVLCSLFEPPADEPFEATDVEGEVRLLKNREACASGRVEVISFLTHDRISAQQAILSVLHAHVPNEDSVAISKPWRFFFSWYRSQPHRHAVPAYAMWIRCYLAKRRPAWV